MGIQNAQAKARNAGKAAETRSEETGQEAGYQLDDQFESFDTAVADSIVDLRGARIMQQVLTRLAGGDMGKIAPQMFKSFEQGTLASLGEQVKQLTEWHGKPLKTLAPSDKPKP
ncbi:hypothetical protein COO91_03398 [Nostoc flagelliforme CCNUN1]|uniref:Uncharacterized protein n=1 Tax=Nostoc flagelliforme CCNUN1 TaxID=2038116 RepID=A0A2K8SQ77_9NOSO|nr:hypothetical protein [Nostoc flagelliforme]AUB37453.1 hypothetical protein COO91_03398 [Nostoc flagelliforme CCNUN1]